MERCAELVPGFFDIYAGRLCRYSHTFTLPGQDAPRPLPSPPRILCFFLPAGNASLRERISVRAVAEEGGYNLGCGRGRYCGSSGPAAMVLATFRNLSCIPRRSPCPERYPLPLALGFPSLSRNQQHLPMESLPGPISSPSGVPLPTNTFSHLTKSLSGSMPAPSGVRPPTKSPTSTPVYPQPHRSFQPPIQPHPFFS